MQSALTKQRQRRKHLAAPLALAPSPWPPYSPPALPFPGHSDKSCYLGAERARGQSSPHN